MLDLVTGTFEKKSGNLDVLEILVSKNIKGNIARMSKLSFKSLSSMLQSSENF